MKSLSKLLLIYLSLIQVALGGWTRISPNSLKFEGRIQAETLQDLLDIVSHNDKFITVDSGGGDAESGLALGRYLLSRDFHVIVDGHCASSCANYVFLAGKTKTIRRGWVGFHGNITAFLEQSWDNDSLLNTDMSPEDLDELHKKLKTVSLQEQAFLAMIGVDQRLFDLGQQLDKGIGDGVERELLIPSTDAFLEFGVKGVEGEQDVSSLIESKTLFRLYL